MLILVVNAGSSSLKLSLLDDDDRLVAEHELAAPRAIVDEAELRSVLSGRWRDADAVAHRIVHGGERFREAVLVDTEVEQALRDLVDLAPLHQPKSLAALEAVGRAMPGVPAVACFDTAFHGSLPPEAATFALPETWRRRWSLRRYGFHGLSHAYAARRAAQLLARPVTELRIVTCHLGAGASLAAVDRGRSVDTTMGFTPLDGLVMATRSGSVDPGLLIWLGERAQIGFAEMSDALEHESGMAGLAGTGDMRAVVERMQRGQPDATLAFDVYLHRLVAGIAQMTAALGGIDALAFTGGVGEAAPAVRAAAASRLGFLGVAIDEELNRSPQLDAVISTDAAPTQSVVLRAREDLEMARQVRSLQTGAQSASP